MDNRDFKTICMTEDYWATSPFSLARHFGRIKVGGHVYVIVNKEGKDIFQLSFEAEKAGREMAIEPGEPADLCREDFVRYYRKLGRDRFLKVLEDNHHSTDSELKRLMRKAAGEPAGDFQRIVPTEGQKKKTLGRRTDK